MPKHEDAEKIDPCYQERMKAYDCLHKNDFDKEKCELYFLNHKNCKTFWYNVTVDRRRKHIKPSLPDIGEREQIKAEYLKGNPSQT